MGLVDVVVVVAVMISMRKMKWILVLMCRTLYRGFWVVFCELMRNRMVLMVIHFVFSVVDGNLSVC